MPTMRIKVFLALFFIILIYPSSSFAATEQHIALVIGNSAYKSGPLKNPVNDATDMAAMLKKLGFSVTFKKNARLQEMDEAIEAFGNRLKRGGVGLFYYAGHGVQINGTNYLLPIDAKINKEADVKYQAIDANKILDEMATANNGLNIVMLDACRDNPFARSFRNASRGLAIVSSAPSGTFISYSTSPGNVARDGDGRNSPYTAALLEYMQEPGVTIGDVFINVRSKLKKETGQVPWELSSLEGKFYFVSGPSKMGTDVSASQKMVTEKDASKLATTDILDDESKKLEDEERKLEKEKALLERKKALEEKRRKIEEEKAALEAKKSTSLAMVKRPSATTAQSEREERATRIIVGRWKCDIVTGGIVDILSNKDAAGYKIKQVSEESRGSSPGDIIGEFEFNGTGEYDFIGRHIWGGSKSGKTEWGRPMMMTITVLDSSSIKIRYLDSVYTDGWVYTKIGNY